MARIELQEPGGANSVDYSVNGLVVTVGGITVNCAEMQQDHQVLIDICDNGRGGFTLGATDDSPYVMNIVIPPRQYQDVPDGEDEDGSPKTRREPVPLKNSEVTLRLWPYIGKQES